MWPILLAVILGQSLPAGGLGGSKAETKPNLRVPTRQGAAGPFGLLPPGCETLGPPPCDTFVPLSQGSHPTLKRKPHTILYLHFDGVTLTAGNDDPVAGQSSVLQMQSVAQVDIPPFDVSGYRMPGRLSTREEAIRAVAGWVADKFGAFDVQVVTERPPDSVPYTMAVVGGSKDLLQMEQGTIGVAPMDCGDNVPNNVIFAFSNDVHDLKELAMVICHEAGHAMGLAHVDQEDAIMYPYSSADEDWRAGNVPDGYACDGSTHQDSFQVLKANLGVRPEAMDPWIQFVAPGQDAVGQAFDLALVETADDVVVTQVEYSLDGSELAVTKWPDFSLALPNLGPGEHVLTAVAQDSKDVDGNTRAAQVSVKFTVDPQCNVKGTCAAGLLPVGALCEDGSQCASGVCAQSQDGLAVCAKACDGADPCPVLVGLSDQNLADTACTCAEDSGACCVPAQEDCANGKDDDCDGKIDCQDTEDCGTSKMCTGFEVCDNEIDDDFDGLKNCEDPDCYGDPACGCAPSDEDCTNGQDDDCDGLVDCADPDCRLDSYCTNPPEQHMYCGGGPGPLTLIGQTPEGGGGIGGRRLRGCRSAPEAPGPWVLVASLFLLLALLRRRRPRASGPGRTPGR